MEAKESILRICLASLQSSLGSEAPSSVSESLFMVEQQVMLTFPIFQFFLPLTIGRLFAKNAASIGCHARPAMRSCSSLSAKRFLAP